MIIEGFTIYDLANLAKERKCTIGVTPYWDVQLCSLSGFTIRHEKFALTINPDKILERDFKLIRQCIMLNRDYICGFNEELFSSNDNEFVSEFLLADYASKLSVDHDVPEEFQESFEHNMYRGFNWSMVACCVQYLLENQENVLTMSNIMRAPCFYENALEVVTMAEDITLYGLVNELYLCDKIRRHG